MRLYMATLNISQSLQLAFQSSQALEQSIVKCSRKVGENQYSDIVNPKL